MTRKQQRRNLEKHYRGLRKKLLADHAMSHWDAILEESRHHIIKNQLPTKDT